jgi:hypothetical protein
LASEIVEIESESKSDSEEDTCFRVVYEKVAEPVQTIRENPYPKDIKVMSEREADEEARFGEVFRWSSDSEGETAKIGGADKDRLVPIVYERQPWEDMSKTIVLIAETEDPEERQQADPEEIQRADPEERQQADPKNDETVVETVVDQKVAKQFEAGLFIGEITGVTSTRGRNLYSILYEDGDGEDMHDRELKEARSLYKQTNGRSSNKVET